MRIIIFIFFITALFFSASAQSPSGDRILSVDEFMNEVRTYHPYALRAGLQVRKAEANLQASRGAFDPALSANADRKTFDGKNYYYYTNPELKLPLPVGDIYAGIENNGGNFLANEVTSGQSSYLGLSIPVLKGLLLDRRRASLQQAKIQITQSSQEQAAMLNDLFFEAYVAYWQWAGAYNLYQVYSDFLSVSEARTRLVRIGFVNGDRSGMDTTEASTQVLQFRIMQSEALRELNNTKLQLSNYLWAPDGDPFLIGEQVLPDARAFNNITDPAGIEDLVALSFLSNPNLLLYNYKIQQLEVERRLKRQSLLPTVNLKANMLNRDYFVLKGFNSALLQNNYKWGIDVKVPLLWREARGDYKLAKLKIQETNYELLQKQRATEVKIRNYFNDYLILDKQLTLAQVAYEQYANLVRNEVLRFQNGESSLFVLNNRENKALEMLEKNISIRIKLWKARYAIEWAAGILQ